MIWALSALAADAAPPPLAVFDACEAGDGEACATAARHTDSGADALWTAGCRAGVDAACAEVTAQGPGRVPADAVYRACFVHGTPSACAWVRTTPRNTAVAATLCAEGVAKACDPLGGIDFVHGPVKGLNVGAGGGGDLLPFADGTWFVGREAVTAVPADPAAATATLYTAPSALDLRGRAIDLFELGKIPARPASGPQWRPDTGEVVALPCGIAAPFRATLDCRIFRGKRLVHARDPRHEQVVQAGGHLWVLSPDRVTVHDGVGPPVVAAVDPNSWPRLAGAVGDGVLLARRNRGVDLLDPATALPRWSLPEEDSGGDPELSPDGNWLALRSGEALLLVDPATGAVGYRAACRAWDAVWSASGDLLVAIEGRLVTLEIGAGTRPLPPMPALAYPKGWPTPIPWRYQLVPQGFDTPPDWRSDFPTDGDLLVVPGDATAVQVGVDDVLGSVGRTPTEAERGRVTAWPVVARRITAHLEDCGHAKILVGQGDPNLSGRGASTDASCTAVLPSQIGDARTTIYVRGSPERWADVSAAPGDEVTLAKLPAPPAQPPQPTMPVVSARGEPCIGCGVAGADPDDAGRIPLESHRSAANADRLWVEGPGGPTLVLGVVPVRLTRPPGVSGLLWVRVERGSAAIWQLRADVDAVDWSAEVGRWRIGVLADDGRSAVVVVDVTEGGEIALPTPAHRVEIRGRALRSDGTPYVDQSLALVLGQRADVHREATVSVKTSLSGRFAVAVPDPAATYALRADDRGPARKLTAGDHGDVPLWLPSSLGLQGEPGPLGLVVGGTCRSDAVVPGDVLTAACARPLAGVPLVDLVDAVRAAGTCEASVLHRDRTIGGVTLPLSETPPAFGEGAAFPCGMPLDATRGTGGWFVVVAPGTGPHPGPEDAVQVLGFGKTARPGTQTVDPVKTVSPRSLEPAVGEALGQVGAGGRVVVWTEAGTYDLQLVAIGG